MHHSQGQRGRGDRVAQLVHDPVQEAGPAGIRGDIVDHVPGVVSARLLGLVASGKKASRPAVVCW